MTRALVTGCAGFIGSNLTDRLLAMGHTVVGVDCFDDYYERAAKESNLALAQSSPRFVLEERSLQQLATAPGSTQGRSELERLLDDVACVFHLAGQPGVRGSWGRSFGRYVDNNILATQAVLEAASAAGVARVVYASSSSVYGDQPALPLREDMLPIPRSPYGVTKLAAEQLCGLYDASGRVSTTALRFFTVYGPRQRPDMAFHRFMTALGGGQSISVFGDGYQTRDFTYVDDIVDALIAAMEQAASGVINIGGGNRVSLLEAIATLGEVMGVEPRLELLPAQAGDVRDTLADVSHAEALLGFRPKVRLGEGLGRQWNWYRGSASMPQLRVSPSSSGITASQ